MQNADEDIARLSDYAHARLRTEMYLGSRTATEQDVLIYNHDLQPSIQRMTWVPALFTAFREILDNACDEVIAKGHGHNIWVEHHVQGSEFSVRDDGRGIPCSWDEQEGMHKATLALSHARTGRNFGARQEQAGTNGVGGAIVNFTSSRFIMDIWRDGQHFHQEFQQGHALMMDELWTHKPCITACSPDRHGTQIAWQPSAQVFADMTLPQELVWSRVAEVAMVNPHVRVHYNGRKIAVKNRMAHSLFGRSHDFAMVCTGDNFVSEFMLQPDFHAGSEAFCHSMVNNIPCWQGGTHMEAWRKNFYKNLLDAMAKESKKRKLVPNAADVMQGMLVVNVTNMHAPSFDSQSKTRLINESAGQCIAQSLRDPEIYKNIMKTQKTWIDAIYARCEQRTHRRDAEQVDKLSKKLARAKIPKLMDANSKNRSECILLITEGESAKMGSAAARNPQIHAALDLRGKSMNVVGAAAMDIMANRELCDIMMSVGLVLNTPVDRSKLRYGQIWLATDADLDGANIAALLVNFLYTQWPALFDPEQPALVSILQTPYLIAKKGTQRRYWYAHNAHEFDATAWPGWSITRAKGLGALEEPDWKHALAHPVLMGITDDGHLKDTLHLIFGKDRDSADLRKNWMGI